MEDKSKSSSKFKDWAIRRKWDIVFGVIVMLILFVPSIRMPVVSTVQRLLAFSPSELAEKNQVTVNSYDWQLMDLEGNQYNFSASSEKVIVLNLWATWCPPCVAEMPSLQKLYDKYGDDLAFYLVSNEHPETIKRFMDKHQYTFPVYIPQGNSPREFESNSLPTTYILDQEGTIIIKEVGAHNWFSKSFQEKIDNLLAVYPT